jgi:hypothetical protein
MNIFKFHLLKLPQILTEWMGWVYYYVKHFEVKINFTQKNSAKLTVILSA